MTNTNNEETQKNKKCPTCKANVFFSDNFCIKCGFEFSKIPTSKSEKLFALKKQLDEGLINAKEFALLKNEIIPEVENTFENKKVDIKEDPKIEIEEKLMESSLQEPPQNIKVQEELILEQKIEPIQEHKKSNSQEPSTIVEVKNEQQAEAEEKQSKPNVEVQPEKSKENKKSKKSLYVILTLFLLIIIGATTWFLIIKPRQIAKEKESSKIIRTAGLIYDFENIFSPGEEKSLELLIRDIELKSKLEITIITLYGAETDKSDFYNAILALARKLNIIKKGKDNLILIGISKNFRKIRIYNGWDIVAKITDEETQRIINNTILPQFKIGKYFNGTNDGIIELQKEFQGIGNK
jgi:uncharacterized protein